MSEIEQRSEPASGIVGRAKAILVSPTSEWPIIAAENESVQSVFLRYVVPLAAIGPICGFIGGQVFGINLYIVRVHPTLMAGLSTAITAYILALLSIFVVAWVANFLADKFGGQVNFARAFQLCAYSYTAAYLAGVFQIVPALAILALLAALYGFYLFYLGSTPMMAVPKEKAAGYTAVTVVGIIVVYLIVGAIMSAVASPLGGLVGP